MLVRAGPDRAGRPCISSGLKNDQALHVLELILLVASGQGGLDWARECLSYFDQH